MASGQTGVTIRVVRNDCAAVSAELHTAVVDEIKRTGLAIEADAKARAPVRTGTLRRSIHTVITTGGLQATVGPSVEYGIYVEFGARGRGPRPYLRPAFEKVVPQAVDRIKQLLKGLGS